MTSLRIVLAKENAVTGRVAAAHLLFKLSVLKDRQDGVKCLFLLYFVHDFKIVSLGIMFKLFDIHLEILFLILHSYIHTKYC